MQTRLEWAVELAQAKAHQACVDTLVDALPEFEGQEEPAFSRLLGEYHFWIGYSDFYLGDYEGARAGLHVADSIVFAMDGPGTDLRARIRRLQGTLAYFADENAYKAQQLYNSAYQEWLLVSPVDTVEYAVVLQCMGQAAGRLGEYDKSVDLYEQSLQIRQEYYGCDHWRVGWAYWNLGNTHFYADQFEESRLAYEQALEILEQETPDDVGTIANIKGNLAQSYYWLGRYDDAINSLKTAIRLQEEKFGKNDLQLPIHLSNLAMFYAEKKEFGLADEALRRATNICHLNGLTAGKQLAWLKLKKAVVANARQGQEGEAFAELQEAMLAIAPNIDTRDALSYPQANETNEPVLLQDIALLKAGLLLTKAQTVEDKRLFLMASLSGFELAGKLSDRLRFEYEDQDDKLSLSDKGARYLREALSVSQQLWEISGNRRYLDAAFRFMERNKFQLLLEFFKRSQVQVAGEMEDTEFKRLLSLQGRCAELDFLLSQPTLSPDSQRIARKELLEKRQSMRLLTDSLERRSLLFRTTQSNQSIVSLDSFLRSNDDPNLGILNYALSDSSLFVISAIDDEVNLRSFPLPLGFRDSIFAFQSTCLRVAETTPEFDRFGRLGHDLFKQLLAPELEKFGTRAKHLLVIPDNILGNLPFEALLDKPVPAGLQNYSKFPYLIRRYPIHYGASANLWSAQQRERNENQPLECLGIAWGNVHNTMLPGIKSSPPPLPGTIEEIELLRSEIQGKYLVGTDASETAFKQFASQFGILHLALHASAASEPKILFPLGGDGNDGVLNFHELFQMRLRARLAVLSACETGTGKHQQGEGIQSMASGFAASGIPSLLVSLWEVDDRAGSTIMRQFYQGLSTGLPIDIALREAKLAYLEDARGFRAAPFYWTAFVPMGNMAPVTTQPASGDYRWSILTGSLLALCILAIFGIYKKKHRST